MTSFTSEDEIATVAPKLQRLQAALNGVLFGQEQLIDSVIVGLLSRGHLLLEGLPGLGKTELVKAIGKAIGLSCRRIQFTPDLLPGDITGNPILNDSNGERRFVFRLHGRDGVRRYALIDTGKDSLLHLVRDQGARLNA